MLVLRRRKDEFVRIDLSNLTTLIKNNPALLQEILSKPVKVCVSEVHGKQVGLAFDADKLIVIDRAEVANKKAKQYAKA